MAITLSTTYKEILPANVVEVIDDLVEQDYSLDDVLSTVDFFGEKYYDLLEEIYDTLENVGCSNSELYDFLEEYDACSLEYYEDYYKLVDDHDVDAVDAFIYLYGIEELKNFEDAYEGYYGRVEDFVDYIIEGYGESIPSWVVIDAEATWNCSLRHDYSEHKDYYFRDF